MSVGIAYVGLASAPTSEVSYLANQFQREKGEVEVSFLPFEFNPKNPFGNATQLIHETLPGMNGKLRITVDLKWFVHGEDAVYGRAASKAFWKSWANYSKDQPQPGPIAAFLDRVHQADLWVAQNRQWAESRHLEGHLGITFVPVLEDECQTEAAYTKLVNAVKAQQKADGISATSLRRSKNGDNSAEFRIANVAMEYHGSWSEVSNLFQRGDTWSNDGTTYGINGEKSGPNNNFVMDAKSAQSKGVSILYWNKDMNGTPKKETNWDSRIVFVFSDSTEVANKARLKQVLKI